MGIVREPEGVDFIIKSRPLTKKEEKLISEFIREQKARRLKKTSNQKTKKRVSLKKKTIS